MTDSELMQELQTNSEFNPWLDVAKDWLRNVNEGNSRASFIHPNDEEAVKRHNEAAKVWCERKKQEGEKVSVEDFQLHRDIMPQPFIGNPCAPVWELSDLTPEAALSIRQKLVCKQLKFESGDDEAFYILRGEFKTMDRSGMAVFGGYNWYMKYFVCNHSYVASATNYLKDLSRNVFVLEYIPYHSKQYFESRQRFLHHNLWENLIKHGLESKILIMRGNIYKKIPDIVKNNDELKDEFFKAESERRIVVFKGQSANLTPANTYWPCSISREVNPLLRIMT